MLLEGKANQKNLVFFEASGFREFNFALLQKLNSVQQTVSGYSELTATRPDKEAERRLKQSLTQLSSVVDSLQILLQLTRVYDNAEVLTIHPEKLFKTLASQHRWPQTSSTTYQTLLVSVAEQAFVEVLAQLFSLEKVPLKNLSVSFRRREATIVVRIYTPKFNWVSSQINGLAKQADFCHPKMSDSLNIILIRACMCVLQKYQISLSISAIQHQSLYVHLPAARQMRVFAELD